MMFLAAIFLVAVLAGGIAAVAGFGIGSLLTPVLAIQVGMKLAVAAIAIPHALATALRLWTLRHHIDRKVLWNFGLTSAAGGLAGALLHNLAGSTALTLVFAALLVFAGLLGLAGWSERLRFGRRTAWVGGAVSGLLGGLVGNQGGIRSAAMLGFDVPPRAFVATATAIALFVDAARLPVYVATEAAGLGRLGPELLVVTAGAVVGTLVGKRVLGRIPAAVFRRVVGALILALGVYMFLRTWTGA